MTRAFTVARRSAGRLAIVALLAGLVSGVTYAVAYSPVASSVVGVRGGPPGGRPGFAGAGQEAQAGQRPGFVPSDTAGQPAVSEHPSAANQATVAGPSSSVSASGTVAQAAPARRPEGGGRGPSFTRGLPELGRYAAVIGVLMLVVTFGRGVVRFRRKRAPRVSHT